MRSADDQTQATKGTEHQRTRTFHRAEVLADNMNIDNKKEEQTNKNLCQQEECRIKTKASMMGTTKLPRAHQYQRNYQAQ